MRENCWPTFFLLVMMGITAGCSFLRSSPFDQTLETQVTAGVSFAQVAQDPSAHTGQILKVGGEVISAKRLMDWTEVMVLQLPLDRDSVPERNRSSSHGRFLATRETFLDPATLPKGTRLTIIGEVIGQASDRADGEAAVFPILAVKAMKVWPVIPLSAYGYRPGWVPFWGWWYIPRFAGYEGFLPFPHYPGAF
jgi:outer membrane lipoprotein